MERYDAIAAKFQSAYRQAENGKSVKVDADVLKFLDTVVAGTEKELKGQKKADAVAFYESWSVANTRPERFYNRIRQYREAASAMGNGSVDLQMLAELCRVLKIMSETSDI
jgi:hypothetical protein